MSRQSIVKIGDNKAVLYNGVHNKNDKGMHLSSSRTV